MSTQALTGVPAGEQPLLARVQQLQALIESARQVANGEASTISSTSSSTTASASATGTDFASALQDATAADSESAAGASAPGYASYAAYSPYSSLAGVTSGLNTADDSVLGDSTAGTSALGALSGASAGAEGGEYEGMIVQAAARNGISPALLHGLIEQESGFDPSAVSSAGASGLTQLMPSTASSLGVSNPLDPGEAIEGGARLLGELMRQFDGNPSYALAGYNAGAGAVQEYGGVPPYPETESYVTKVLGYAQSYSQAHPETTDTTGALT